MSSNVALYRALLIKILINPGSAQGTKGGLNLKFYIDNLF